MVQLLYQTVCYLYHKMYVCTYFMKLIAYLCKVKKLTAFICVVLALLQFSFLVYSQDYSTESKKAIKYFEKGKEYFDNRENAAALLELSQAIQKDALFVEPHILSAVIHTENRNSIEAINSYRKAVAVNPDFFPPNYFNLGTLELGEGFYVQAELHFKEFLKYTGLEKKYIELAKHKLAVCRFAQESMKHPVPFEPMNLGPNVNSSYDEYFPGLKADENLLLYTRRIKDKANYFGEQEDFFVSVKKDGKWQKNYNIGPPINTHHNEGSPTISPDGQLIIFSACEELDGYGPGRSGFGSCDIFFVKKLGDQWSKPMNIGPPISSKAWDVQPSYASDGKTLYFVSQRKGTLGNADIWVSQLTPQGFWGEPKNLGPTINTSGKEEAVFIHPDNQTLYFASDGHVGMGGLDIFVSKRGKDGEWGTPKNLGYPINTFNDENGLIVGASGEIAFFTSNRDGGQGGLDLYSFTLHEGVRPGRVTYVKGIVYNSISNKKLGSKFELIDLESGKVVLESYSNKIDGEFLVCLPINKDYALNVSKKGYLFYSDNFSLKSESLGSAPFLMDVPLQPIKKGANIVLKNIFFETGSYELKPQSMVELKRVVSFLNENSTIKVEIGGHTDNVGDDKSNQLLSENRAKSVFEYLVHQKVQEERLSYKGYGEEKPIRSNNDAKGRARNRRTEFKIIELN